MICTPQLRLIGWSNPKEWNGRDICHTWGTEQECNLQGFR